MKVRDQRIQAVQDDKKSKRPVDLGWIFFQMKGRDLRTLKCTVYEPRQKRRGKRMQN